MKKIFLLLFVVFISSCKTDFDTIAPYKEVMVAYGLLNPNESIQYIRIGKAYLGEGNSLVMAQQSDSINYADILDVKMERTMNNVTASYPLIRIDSIPKESGVFNSYQVLYADTNNVLSSATYKIIIRNTVTGLTAIGSTGIVGNTRKQDGSDGLENPSTTSIGFTGTQSIYVKFVPGNFSKAYNTTLRFYYLEKDISGVPYTVSKSFDWNLGDQNLSNNVSDGVTFPFIKRDFFIAVAAGVLPDPNKRRQMQSGFHIMTTGITEDLYTYISLTNPSGGIAQDRPFYSNVENAIGIFSSRNVRLHNYNISTQSIDSLQTNPNTSNLNFVDSL
jgi:hypothetical protein